MSEEEKAIKWLKEKTEDYNLDGKELHYLKIIYYLLRRYVNE